MWDDLPLSAREALKACHNKEELLLTAAKCCPYDDFDGRFVWEENGGFRWEEDHWTFREHAGEVMFYARLGAEIAKEMNAEKYGSDPLEDAMRYSDPSALSQAWLRELAGNRNTAMPTEISVQPQPDAMNRPERILLNYFYNPDYPVPKNEADRILRRARRASRPTLSDKPDRLFKILADDIGRMDSSRALVRGMADRIDHHFGIVDKGERHRKIFHGLTELPNPEDPYQPLRRLGSLFEAEVKLYERMKKEDCCCTN